MKLLDKQKNLLPPTVVDVDTNKLTICDNRSGTTIVCPFPQGWLKDMEVVNHEEMVKQLTTFINQHRLEPTHVVLVLSTGVYFEKNLPRLSEEEQKTQMQKFLDIVPFGRVSSKVFKVGNEIKLVAINRDFYESIKRALEKYGFAVAAVVPDFVLGALGIKGDFNIEACRLILRRMDYVLENSFLTPDMENISGVEKKRMFLKSHSAVFAILSLVSVAVAGVTAVWTLRRPTPKPMPAMVVVSPIPSPPASPTPEATPAGLLTTLILITAQGELDPGVNSELKSLGFATIDVNPSSIVTEKTLVVFTPRVAPTLREAVTDKLQIFFETVSTQENPSGEYDITITTGKQRS